MATLRRAVVLTDPSGSAVLISAGKRVPRWAEKLIRNPDLWASRPPARATADDPGSPGDGDGEPGDDTAVVPEGIPTVPHVGVEDSTDDAEWEDVEIPPKSGPAGSRQKWADYAEDNGVAVEAGWKRDDIIGACERAGVPVE